MAKNTFSFEDATTPSTSSFEEALDIPRENNRREQSDIDLIGDPQGFGSQAIETSSSKKPLIASRAPEIGGNFDPMLNPKFVEDFRSELASLPIEKRLNALRAYAETDTSVYGRAAKVILADEEYKNAKVTMDGKREAMSLLPTLKDQTQKTGKGQAKQPSFPESNPNIFEQSDGITDQQVAGANALAMGIGGAREEAMTPASLYAAKRELNADADAKTRAYAESLPGPLRGYAKGAGQLVGLSQGSIGLIGDIIGNDELKDWGLQQYKDTMDYVQNYSVAKNFTNIESPSDAVGWVSENSGYVAFQAAQAILSGGLGSLIGEKLGKEALGAFVGMAVANGAQTYGSVYGEAVDEAVRTGTEVDVPRVLVGATVSTAIDTLADKIGLSSISAKGFKGSALARIGKAGAVQMGTQGATEAAQLVPEEFGAGRDPFRKGMMPQYINEAAVGSLGGVGPAAIQSIKRAPSNAQEEIAQALSNELDSGIQNPDWNQSAINEQVRQNPIVSVLDKNNTLDKSIAIAMDATSAPVAEPRGQIATNQRLEAVQRAATIEGESQIAAALKAALQTPIEPASIPEVDNGTTNQVQSPSTGSIGRGDTVAPPSMAVIEKDDGNVAMSSRVGNGSTPSEFQPLANQSAAKVLNDALVKYKLGREWSNAYEAVKLPDYLSGIRQAFQVAFGRDIRAVVPTEERFNIFGGVYIASQPDSLYVNVAGKVGFVNIAGHELWHSIKRQRPDLIEWYRENSRKYYKDLPAYRNRLNKLLQPGEKKYNLDKAEEELEGDFLGDSLTDGDFLQSLADASPAKFKALLTHVRLWLEKVLNKIKGLGSTEEVNDVKALQSYLKEVLVAFADGKNISTEVVAPPSFARVWHGSPHKFYKFDSSKIGTGEGAQAYGHGIYLAENPKVAIEYKQALGAGRGAGQDDVIARALDFANGNTSKAAADLEQRATYANIPGGKEKLLAMAQKLRDGYDPRGSLYQVDLPDEQIAKMLDWDTPLSQQAAEVQAAIGSALTERGIQKSVAEYIVQNKSGSEALSALSRGHYDVRLNVPDGSMAAEASRRLKEAGIPGIRYLDGGSRGDGVGTSNYVIFPGMEHILTIIDVNGKAVTGAERDAVIAEQTSIAFSRAKNDADNNIDGVDSDMRFSRSGPAIPQSPIDYTTKVIDNLIYNFQDRFIDLRKIQKSAGPVPEIQDASLAEKRYSGMVRAKTDDFHDDMVNPLLKEIHESNLEYEEVEEYLHAKHAPSRNAAMKEINPTESELNAIRADLTNIHDMLVDVDAVQEYIAKRREIRQAESDVEDGVADDSLVAILKTDLAALKNDKDVKIYINAVDRLKALKTARPYKGDNTALSGMSDAKAKSVISNAKQDGKDKALNSISQRVDAITNATRKIFTASGLETQETINAWEAKYDHYVPLHTDEVRDGMPAVGQGYNIRGKESKRATGSTKERSNILAHVVAQHEAAIIRAEKVKVDRALFEFIQTHPDENVWVLDDAEMVRTVNPVSKLVESRVNPIYKQKPNVLVLKIAGEEHTITFNEKNPEAVRLAASMKNLSGAELGEVTILIGKFTRFLATMNTSANPVFVARNFMRDLQTSFVNLSDTEIADKKRAVFANVPNAIRGFWDMNRGKMNSEYAKYAREFRDAGGLAGWLEHYKDIGSRADKLKAALEVMKDGKLNFTKREAAAWWKLIEDGNMAVENGVRLAAYVQARKSGMSEAKSALLAKELTVNFNTHGAKGVEVNMWYMFMNASIQGTARLIKAVGNKNVQKILGFVTLSGFTLSILARAMAGDDDDDGENDYDQLPEYVKDKNFVFWAGRPITIPMPYGYNFFATLGRKIGDSMFRKNFSPARGAIDVTASFFDAFSPLGQAGSGLQLVAPTIADPFIQWSENKNFAGNPLRKDQIPFSTPKPEYQMGFKSTSAPAKWLAELLNSSSGGNTVRPGMLNVNPAAFDFAVSSVLGGAGRTYLQMVSLPIKAISGDEIQVREVPGLNIFASASPESQAERKFFENIKSVETAVNEFKAYHGDAEMAEKLNKEHGAERRLAESAKLSAKLLSALRERERLLTENKPEGWRESMKAIEKRKAEIINRFNKRYAETEN